MVVASLSLAVATAPLFFAPDALVAMDPHHDSHAKLLQKNIPQYNQMILMAVDLIQERAMDGGGYFVGPKATPAESPIGYPVNLFDLELLKPARTSSYCSGATYTALIEGLNFIYGRPLKKLTVERKDAMRMQEPDGSRREDDVKAWGWWNADGFGSQFSLVQYLGMGERVAASDAKPGDFVNINWKNGHGHSVIFLGWCVNKSGESSIDYWSSQTGTNGFGDQISPIKSIKDLCVVRLTKPQNLFTFDPLAKVDPKIEGEAPPVFGSR